MTVTKRVAMDPDDARGVAALMEGVRISSKLDPDDTRFVLTNIRGLNMARVGRSNLTDADANVDLSGREAYKAMLVSAFFALSPLLSARDRETGDTLASDLAEALTEMIPGVKLTVDVDAPPTRPDDA